MLPRLLHAADVQLLQLPACVLLCWFGVVQGQRCREEETSSGRDDLIRQSRDFSSRGGWQRVQGVSGVDGNCSEREKEPVWLSVISCGFGQFPCGFQALTISGNNFLKASDTPNTSSDALNLAQHQPPQIHPPPPLQKDAASLLPPPAGAVGSSSMC